MKQGPRYAFDFVLLGQLVRQVKFLAASAFDFGLRDMVWRQGRGARGVILSVGLTRAKLV